MQCDNDIENESSRLPSSEDDITKTIFDNKTVHDSNNDYSEDSNRSLIVDIENTYNRVDSDNSNPYSVNKENQIPENKNNESANINGGIDNSVLTKNCGSFNVAINFTSNIFMFQNKNTTVKDHLLSVVALSLRHHLSYEAILDTFRYINISYGTAELPTTKQAFWRALGRNNAQVKKYFYCQECDDFLGKKSSISNKLEQQCCCGACGPEKSNVSEGYFLYNNIKSQIQQLLSTASIIDAIKYRFQRQKRDSNNLEDIYDGSKYKKLISSGILKDWYNLSLTLNTDGCQVANSSNTSAWPIFLQINELPPHLRKKHMLLAAVYVDKKHPLMNNFLRPLMNELRQLYQDGVSWKLPNGVEITSKIIVTMCCFDAPARSAVTRFVQYNGYFSCLYCYIEGKFVSNKKVVFPVLHNSIKLRTKSDIEANMYEASEIGQPVNGVKGISSLITLPLFDISKGVIIESMHAVYLGVVKQHTTLLLTKTKAPYYVGSRNLCGIIDNCLLSIKPPSRRSRKPRSISTYKQWKASEWRNWLDYAPICLKKVLGKKYVNHIALLSEAIHSLNNDSISVGDLERAENLLKKYVYLFQKYFGIISISSNVHLLNHIVQCIRNWGPTWGYSAFTFEAWNKRLLDKLTSSHCRAEQIITRFLMEKFIINSSSDHSVSVETRNYIKKLLKIPATDNNIDSLSKFNCLGKPVKRSPTFQEIEALTAAGYFPDDLTCYKKMSLNKVKYDCHSEERNVKFCNSIINDGNKNYGIIQSIIKFTHENSSVCGLLILTFNKEESAFETRHISRVEISENLVFIRENSKIKPACLMKSSRESYIVTLANCWETD